MRILAREREPKEREARRTTGDDDEKPRRPLARINLSRANQRRPQAQKPEFSVPRDPGPCLSYLSRLSNEKPREEQRGATASFTKPSRFYPRPLISLSSFLRCLSRSFDRFSPPRRRENENASTRARGKGREWNQMLRERAWKARSRRETERERE